MAVNMLLVVSDENLFLGIFDSYIIIISAQFLS